MASIFRRGLSLLRHQSFDTSDEPGRSKERYRRAALTTLAAFGARGIQILTSLITVPLTLHYLGVERYGMWMTMSSLVAMLGFADLGVGNGLLNAISDAYGRDSREDAARSVSSAFFALLGIASVLGVAFVFAYPYIPWSAVFNVRSQIAASEAGPAVAVLVGTFLLGLPLGIVSRVRAGYQEGFVDSLWTSGGSLAALLLVLAAVRLRIGLPGLVFAMAASPLLAVSLNGFWLFKYSRPWLKPRWSAATKGEARAILGAGVYFFILQIAGAVAYQSDSLVLAHVISPSAVAQYAVPMKLFMLVPTILGFVVAPLWPAYAEAFARGDRGWARVTLRRSLKLALLVSVPTCTLLVLLGKPLLDLWVGPSIRPTWLFLVAAGIWGVMGAVSGALAMFLNGARVLRFQAVMAILMMTANIALSIYLAGRVGVSGVVWGSIFAQLLFILVPDAVYLRWVFPTRPADRVV